MAWGVSFTKVTAEPLVVLNEKGAPLTSRVTVKGGWFNWPDALVWKINSAVPSQKYRLASSSELGSAPIDFFTKQTFSR